MKLGSPEVERSSTFTDQTGGDSSLLGTVAVEARGLTKMFGTNRAVDAVDLTVMEGEVFGVLGPNGAGKTTMLNMLTTLLPIDGGEAKIFGYDVRREGPRIHHRHCHCSRGSGGSCGRDGRTVHHHYAARRRPAKCHGRSGGKARPGDRYGCPARRRPTIRRYAGHRRRRRQSDAGRR